jgi:hypothetical protein
VSLPWRCPHCGSGVKETGAVSQYQTEIPEPRVQRIDFGFIGPLPALSAAGARPASATGLAGGGQCGLELGPRAPAVLNKQLGLPYGKTAAVLEQGGG